MLRFARFDVPPGAGVDASRQGERIRLPDHREVEDALLQHLPIPQTRHIGILAVQPPQSSDRDVSVLPYLGHLVDRQSDGDRCLSGR